MLKADDAPHRGALSKIEKTDWDENLHPRSKRCVRHKMLKRLDVVGDRRAALLGAWPMPS